MNDLIKRFAKAATAELEARHMRQAGEAHVQRLENAARAELLAADPKLAEWKSKIAVAQRLDGDPGHEGARKWTTAAVHAHEKARVRLRVMEEQLKMERAGLYYGRSRTEI